MHIEYVKMKNGKKKEERIRQTYFKNKNAVEKEKKKFMH